MKTGDKVRLTNPQRGEEKLTFIVVNLNEATKRAIIELIGAGTTFSPTELVSLNDVELI